MLILWLSVQRRKCYQRLPCCGEETNMLREQLRRQRLKPFLVCLPSGAGLTQGALQAQEQTELCARWPAAPSRHTANQHSCANGSPQTWGSAAAGAGGSFSVFLASTCAFIADHQNKAGVGGWLQQQPFRQNGTFYAFIVCAVSVCRDTSNNPNMHNVQKGHLCFFLCFFSVLYIYLPPRKSAIDLKRECRHFPEMESHLTPDAVELFFGSSSPRSYLLPGCKMK